MIKLFLFFFAYLIVNTLENFYRERWKYDTKNSRKYSKIWHNVQYIRWCLVFLYVLSAEEFLDFVLSAFLFSTIWWTLFDGFLNLLRQRNFFYQSKQTTSVLEKYALPWVKISLLLVSVLLTIYFKVIL